MVAWQQRVLEERDQLKKRLFSLGQFLRLPSVDELDALDVSLLRDQERVMQSYMDVLNARIERFHD